ncbi:hypothetical protein KKG22_00920 [Patescibacteria group bacterium]|nr:hypothetical protein [Patescibacteria group bacterium]MBU1721997.1 hypothetical protein [Patescibacteria group bacterium]MBU1901253.1 hypothetical protein [Patescibacteria group bacterium]
MQRRIIEAGHYYSAKGPTQWSVVGWNILQEIITPHDTSVLFIDDVHPISDVHAQEQLLQTMPFTPSADITILESDMMESALQSLYALQQLSKRKKARRKNKQWFCSGFPITNQQETPLCVLLDTALTQKKHSLGYSSGINILPYYYEPGQHALRRLIAKLIPEFQLEIILYDLNGNYRNV